MNQKLQLFLILMTICLKVNSFESNKTLIEEQLVVMKEEILENCRARGSLGRNYINEEVSKCLSNCGLKWSVNFDTIHNQNELKTKYEPKSICCSINYATDCIIDTLRIIVGKIALKLLFKIILYKKQFMISVINGLIHKKCDPIKYNRKISDI
jgi:hypothetical protein